MKKLNQTILNNFPNIELFYDITYKKVSNYKFILAIPKGNKSFIWFTKINNKNCLVLVDKNKNLLYLLNNKYNFELSDTILYGTSFKIENKLYFSIEDLFYYKKNNISFEPFQNKLNIINEILINDIYKIDDYDNSIIIGIPPISSNYSELINIITTNSIPYEIKELKFILQNNHVKYQKYENNVRKEIIKKNIFKVIPDTRTDIYNLYLLNKSTNIYEFHSIAFIPDYKSSIMMSKLFRGLKEHSNLDYLEESDDEFISEDELEHNWKLMECIFNNKFKKWVPVKVFE